MDPGSQMLVSGPIHPSAQALPSSSHSMGQQGGCQHLDRSHIVKGLEGWEGAAQQSGNHINLLVKLQLLSVIVKCEKATGEAHVICHYF